MVREAGPRHEAGDLHGLGCVVEWDDGDRSEGNLLPRRAGGRDLPPRGRAREARAVLGRSVRRGRASVPGRPDRPGPVRAGSRDRAHGSRGRCEIVERDGLRYEGEYRPPGRPFGEWRRTSPEGSWIEGRLMTDAGQVLPFDRLEGEFTEGGFANGLVVKVRYEAGRVVPGFYAGTMLCGNEGCAYRHRVEVRAESRDVGRSTYSTGARRRPMRERQRLHKTIGLRHRRQHRVDSTFGMESTTSSSTTCGRTTSTSAFVTTTRSTTRRTLTSQMTWRTGACSLDQRRAAKYGYQGANRYRRELAGVTRSFSDKCLRIVRYACAGRLPHGTSRTSYTARCAAFCCASTGVPGTSRGAKPSVGTVWTSGTEAPKKLRPLARLHVRPSTTHTNHTTTQSVPTPNTRPEPERSTCYMTGGVCATPRS